MSLVLNVKLFYHEESNPFQFILTLFLSMQTASSLSLRNSICFQSQTCSVSVLEEVQLGLVICNKTNVLRLILFTLFNDADRFVVHLSETSRCHLLWGLTSDMSETRSVVTSCGWFSAEGWILFWKHHFSPVGQLCLPCIYTRAIGYRLVLYTVNCRKTKWYGIWYKTN